MTMDKVESVAAKEVERFSKLGSLRLQQGHSQKALESYRNAYASSKSLGHNGYMQRACAFNLGAILISTGNNNEGLTYLNLAVPPDGRRDGRSNGDLFFNYGLAYGGLKNLTEGMRYFEKALAEYKSENNNVKMEAETIQQLQQLCLEAGQLHEADSWMKQMISAYDALGQVDKSLYTQAQRSGLYLKMDNGAFAEQLADQCFANVEKAASSNATGNVLVELGLVYTVVHKYEKATVCCEKALSQLQFSQAEPSLAAVVYQNLGAIFNHMSRYEEAIEYHTKAAEKHAMLKNRKSQGHCFMNTGYAYSKLNDMEKAGDNFLHSYQAAKDCGDRKSEWQSLEALGAVMYNQKAFNKAQNYYKDALTAFARSPESTDVAVQDRILQKLKQMIEQQIPKASQRITRSSKTEKVPNSSTHEAVILTAKEAASSDIKTHEALKSNLPTIKKKTAVEGSVIAIKEGSKTKYVRVRRRGTLRRFKKIAQGIDPNYTPRSDEDVDEVYGLLKPDMEEEYSAGGLISSAESGKDNRREKHIYEVVELEEGSRKKYIKVRRSGTLRRFKKFVLGLDPESIPDQAEKEKVYEVLEPDSNGELQSDDLLSSEDEESDADEDNKKGNNLRFARPPDSYKPGLSHKALRDVTSGSEEVNDDDDNASEDEETDRLKAEMQRISQSNDETLVKTTYSQAIVKDVSADVHAEPKSANRRSSEASSSDDSDSASYESSDSETEGTSNRRKRAPQRPSHSPPRTDEVRTYEQPLKNSKAIYETIDRKPPSGRLQDDRKGSFALEGESLSLSRRNSNKDGNNYFHADEESENNVEIPSANVKGTIYESIRPPTRRDSNTARNYSDEESVHENEVEDGTNVMSRAERDVIHYDKFRSDMEEKHKREEIEMDPSIITNEKNSRFCIIL